MRSHGCKQSLADFTRVLLQQPKGNSYHFCKKVYGPLVGLMSHMRVLKISADTKENSCACHIYRTNLAREVTYTPCFLLD